MFLFCFHAEYEVFVFPSYLLSGVFRCKFVFMAVFTILWITETIRNLSGEAEEDSDTPTMMMDMHICITWGSLCIMLTTFRQLTLFPSSGDWMSLFVHISYFTTSVGIYSYCSFMSDWGRNYLHVWLPTLKLRFFSRLDSVSGPRPPHCWGFENTLRRTTLVWLLWTSDSPCAETSTWRNTTPTRDRHPCRRRDSNPQSQQASGRRPIY
jgi:hypothetical protein